MIKLDSGFGMAAVWAKMSICTPVKEKWGSSVQRIHRPGMSASLSRGESKRIEIATVLARNAVVHLR